MTRVSLGRRTNTMTSNAAVATRALQHITPFKDKNFDNPPPRNFSYVRASPCCNLEEGAVSKDDIVRERERERDSKREREFGPVTLPTTSITRSRPRRFRACQQIIVDNIRESFVLVLLSRFLGKVSSAYPSSDSTSDSNEYFIGEYNRSNDANVSNVIRVVH